MKILVIADNYPTEFELYRGIFVKNLVEEFVRQGCEVTVIAPQKRHKNKEVILSESKYLKVYRPVFTSLGARKFFGINLRRFSHLLFKNCIENTIKTYQLDFDVIYSHFLFPSGMTAGIIGKWLGKKSYCSLGESNILSYKLDYKVEEIRRVLDGLDGLFPNNIEMKLKIEREYKSKSEITFVPSGVNTKLFYPQNKIVCRNELSLPIDQKIVIFVGGFNSRKGPDRVLQACNHLEINTKQIFIGSGSVQLESDSIIFDGPIHQDKLPLFLNAADVFVLPSRNEGMPNALLEAMACQLPIVTSDISVNKMLLSDYLYSYLVPANDIEKISKAINDALTIKVKSCRNVMFDYSISARAIKILEKLSL
jgi:teichuronic acid biosynthesis glycosyltransferase TuaC